MKLIKKHGKKIALLLSVVLLATAVIGGTLAYVVTKTQSLRNIFIAEHSGDILIKKEVGHPFGNTYQIPEGVDFAFDVALGADYANKDVTVITASEQGGVTKKADGNGVITVSIKPGQTAIIKDVTVGTEAVVKETLSDGSGFTVDGEAVRTVTVKKGENTLEYVNEYNPAPAPAKLEVHGTKVIEGREWIDGDSFTFVLEKYNKANEEWEKLGETAAAYNVITVQEDGINVIKPDPDMDKFSFTELFVDGNGQSIFTEAGTYSFRISEVSGSIPGMVYDSAKYAFDVLVGDADMDGALEIQSVTAVTNNPAISGDSDNGFAVNTTITNKYAPNGYAEVTIEIKKNVVSNSGEDKSPAGFKFELYDKDGNPVEEAVSGSTGDASIKLGYEAEYAGRSFDYILKEKNDGKAGWDYDDTEYPITVNVVDNNDGTISAYIGETDEDDNGSSTPSGNDVSGVSAGDDQSESGLPNGNEEVTTPADPETESEGNDETGEPVGDNETSNNGEVPSSAGPEIVSEGSNETGEQQQGGEGTINTAASNASQSTTVYLTAKRLPNTHSSVTQLTAEETEVILDPGAAQINLSSGQNSGETVYKAAFTNIYTPVLAKGESIPGKKVLNGRSINANEFKFELWTVDDDGDPEDKLHTVFNDADGNFAIDMSNVSYDEVGTYKYAVVEADGDLGGVTYDESRFDIIVTVKDNNGTLETETVIKDKLGAEAEILFTNEYVPAKISFAIGGKKELKGDAYSGEAFGFSLYKANNPAEFIKDGTAIETVTKSEAGDFTFTAIEYTEVGTHYYLVEEVKGSVSGMEYDSTVYGVVVSVTDDGSGQLAAAITKLVKIGGSDVEEILFSNTYTKPVVTPTPTIPVTPTPTPGITPTPPLDDVEIPIYPGESDVPPTGDDNPIGLYVAILLISIAAIAVLMVTGKNGRRSGRRKKRARAR